MPRLVLRTLGGVHVTLDGEPIHDFGSRKTCALLLYLAVESDHVHQRSHLAGLLWPDWPEHAARTYLRQSLAALRDILDDRTSATPYLLATRQTLQFNPRSDYWLDMAELTSCLATATGPHRRAMTRDLTAQLGEVLALYESGFLDGFYLDGCPEFGEWQLLTGEHLRRGVVEALDRLAQWYDQQQELAAALPYARRRVELEPLSEGGHRQYMRLLALSGERSAALALYDEYCDLLRDTLNTEPAQATTALAKRIRSGAFSENVATGRTLFSAEPPEFLQQSTPRTPPPFVARRRELDQLNQQLSAAVSDARWGRILFVTGAAGQGKTALLHEFARRASVTHENLLTLVGHGASHGGIGDPLLPFRQILGQLTGDLHASWSAGILNDVQVRRLWAALPSTLGLLLTQAPDLAGTLVTDAHLRRQIEALPSTEAEPLLTCLSEVDDRTQAPVHQPSLFQHYAGLLCAVACDSPLLILLDDLHWADPDSLSLLFHLGNNLGGSRILVVCAFRPEEMMGPGQDKAHPLQVVYQELQRRGPAPVDLDNVDGRAFVDAYLDREPNHLDSDFRNTLYRLTAGSPLFIAELVRSMQDRGDLVRDAAGRWQEAAYLTWEALPARVEAVIGRRLARLSASQRALLAASSIQGERFAAEVTAAVLNRPAQEITATLSGDLERRHHLVIAEGVERIGDRAMARYRFRHALFQHYLYDQLDAVEQAHYHEATARNLETVYADHADGLAPIAGELAWHCWRANLPDEAIVYHIQAGKWALRLSASEQAQAHFERGMALLEQVADRNNRRQLELQLLTGLATVQSMLYGGASSQVQQTLLRARSLDLRSPDDDLTRFRLMEALWESHHLRDENRTSCQLAESCLEIARKLQQPDVQIRAHCMLASSLVRLGCMARSHRHFQLARKFCDRSLPQEYYMHGFNIDINIRVGDAIVLWYLGYPDQAEQCIAEAIALAEERANTFGLVFALIYACGLHQRRREVHKVLKYAEQAHTLCVENRFAMWEAGARYYRAWVHAMQQDCRTDAAMAEDALLDIEAAGLHQVRYHSILVDIYSRCGRVEEALSLTDQLLTMMDDTDEREWEPEIHRLHGELLLMQDATNAERAELCFLRAIHTAHEQQSRTLALRAATSLCALHHELGQTEPARSQLADLYAWFTEGFDTPDLVAARDLLERMQDPLH